jgi:hypothetical protein
MARETLPAQRAEDLEGVQLAAGPGKWAVSPQHQHGGCERRLSMFHSSAISHLAKGTGSAVVSLTILALGRGQQSTTTTNVADLVQVALNEIGPVAVTTVSSHQEGTGHCVGGSHGDGPCSPIVTVTTKTTTKAVLTASNIHVVTSDPVVFGAKVRTELPNDITLDATTSRNFSDTPINNTFSLVASVQRTTSLTLTHQVTNTLGGDINFDCPILPDMKVGGRLSFGTTTMNSEARLLGSSDTVTRTRQQSVSVPPHTSLVEELEVWAVHYDVPFTTNVVVDADLSVNDNNWAHLSDALSDKAKRTFLIAGTISANDATDGVMAQYVAPDDQKQCGSAQGQFSIPHSLQSKDVAWKFVKLVK